MPPAAKANIRLSISKPARRAKSKSDGGFQYSGTKSGSVSPRRDVHALTTSISLRLSRTRSEIYTTSQIASKIRLQINQMYCIFIDDLLYCMSNYLQHECSECES